MNSICGKNILWESIRRIKSLAFVTLTTGRIGFKYKVGSWNDVIGEWIGSGLILKEVISLRGSTSKGESIKKDASFWWSQVIGNSSTKILLSQSIYISHISNSDENKHF